VENFNGSIEITGHEQDLVEIEGTKYAATEAAMKAMEIDIVSSGDSIRIRTIRPSGHHSNMGARYRIRAPASATLDRVISSNGAIRTTGIRAGLRLETSNGRVEVEDTEGPMEIRTSNGAIRVVNARGSIDARTSNGSITVSLPEPAEGSPLELHTSNGHVELTIGVLRRNDISVSTSNGSITVRLPEPLAAEVRARTSNASITNEFEGAFRGRSDRRYLEGTIGAGGPLLTLTTSNGSIRLLRR